MRSGYCEATLERGQPSTPRFVREFGRSGYLAAAHSQEEIRTNLLRAL
jgi:hypothetical protein